MQTKTEKLKNLVKLKEFDKAFKIARTFKNWESKEDMEQVKLASEIKANASFYRQIGKDVELEYKKGLEVLNRIYGETL